MAGVSLSKGGTVSLTKAASDSGVLLRESVVACGWGISNSDASYDLDLVAAALNAKGQLPEKGWFIYYRNKTAPQEVIRHSGDNLTGGGVGDDESIECNFPAIPLEIERIVFAVNIYRAVTKNQVFGNVENAFVRVFDKSSGTEFVRYNLGAEFANETLVVFGELYRDGGEWQFRAIGKGYAQADFIEEYGRRKYGRKISHF